MRELTFEEMNEVAGGVNPVIAGAIAWAVSKTLDYAWDNRAAILNTMLQGFEGMAQGIATTNMVYEAMFLSTVNSNSSNASNIFYIR